MVDGWLDNIFVEILFDILYIKFQLQIIIIR